MVVVTVVAVVMGMATLWVRGPRFREKAEFCDRMAAKCRAVVARMPASGVTPMYQISSGLGPSRPATVAQLVDRVSYWEVRAKRYRRLARFPWLLVATDPPEPE